jgi:hypothetical protein
MRIVRSSLAVVLSFLIMVPAVHAQGHVIGKSALDAAVQERVTLDEGDRQAIRALLARDDVREVARRAGLSIETAEAAVGAVQGDDLRELATQARQVQNDLAGGASTVVISTTTIIIVLLIVILIVVAVD